MRDRCEHCIGEVREECDRRLELWAGITAREDEIAADLIEQGTHHDGRPVDVDGIIDSHAHLVEPFFKLFSRGLTGYGTNEDDTGIGCELQPEEILYKWRKKIMELRS
jgi:hypothetical protein